MPLSPGSSPKVIGHNIAEMEAAGHSHAQSIAASLHNAGKGKAMVKAGQKKTKGKHDTAHIKRMDKGFHVRTMDSKAGPGEGDDYEGAHNTMGAALKMVRAKLGMGGAEEEGEPEAE